MKIYIQWFNNGQSSSKSLYTIEQLRNFVIDLLDNRVALSDIYLAINI